MKTEKQNIQRLILPMLVMLLALLPVACIEDGISTSPSNQPIFSVDTLDFGERFSEEMSSTMRLMVYNRYDKVMSISDIGLEDEDGPFYLNVRIPTRTKKNHTQLGCGSFLVDSRRFGVLSSPGEKIM